MPLNCKQIAGQDILGNSHSSLPCSKQPPSSNTHRSALLVLIFILVVSFPLRLDLPSFRFPLRYSDENFVCVSNLLNPYNNSHPCHYCWYDKQNHFLKINLKLYLLRELPVWRYATVLKKLVSILVFTRVSPWNIFAPWKVPGIEYSVKKRKI